MRGNDSVTSILTRYQKAARIIPPSPTAETPAALVEGYWIDSHRFFFVAETWEPALGRVVSVPSIADALTKSITEIIELESLAKVLSETTAEPIDLKALSAASFDFPESGLLAVSTAGRDYLVDTHSRRVNSSSAALDAPALYSPDGRHACVVRGPNLALKERKTGAERALTTDGELRYRYGQQSDTGLSAVSYRKRPKPIGLWSPDSQWFLTHRIDDRCLPEMPLIEHAPPGGGRPVLHQYPYPIPGDPLPLATYVACHVRSGRVVAFPDFPIAITAYSPFSVRRAWFGDGNTVWVVRLDRYCKQADLIQLDLSNGRGRVVLSETATSGYLDLHPVIGSPNVRILPQSDEVIWFSERDGWGHLYLYDASTGEEKCRITQGDWLVRDIVHVDEKRRKLLVLIGGLDPRADPAQRSLCSVNMDGSHFDVLASHEGDVFIPSSEPCGLEQARPYCPSYASAGLSPDQRFGVVRYASVDRGNATKILDFQTQRSFSIASAVPASGETPARPFSAIAADGKTCLHGVMFLPSDFDETKRYPLIDYIYPGPQVMQKPQSFRSQNSGQARALAELGFVTFMLNTRNMPASSRNVHQAGYGALLEPQLADHAAVVCQLAERHSFMDRNRIGIIGQSGGGAATARALFDYGDIFKVGVAVCGNHDSTLYAAVWSDKYRGPGDRDAWAAQANTAAAHKLKGKLLLISGDMDENVHVSQTLLVASALVQANKDFDLLIVPNEGHSVLMTSGYAQRRAWDYFVRHLARETPPAEFELKFESYDRDRYLKRSLREYLE